MKKTLISVLGVILALTMIAGTLTSCKKGDVTNPPDSEKQESQSTVGEKESSDEQTDKEIDKETDKGTAESDDQTDREPVEPSEHIDLIQSANGLANGIQAFFTDGGRTHLSIQNQEMILNYARSNRSDQLVESIKNNNGAAYIQNTMDVFVRMSNGDSFDTYYASKSNQSAEANIYRFGYYYYQGMFEFQNFVPKELEIFNSTEIDIKRQYTSCYDVSRSKDNGNISYVITPGATDPRIYFETNFKYVAADYNTFVIRAKALGNTDSIQFFIKTDTVSHNELSSFHIALINDGEYHDYYIPLYNIPGFEGYLEGIRLDPNGSADGGFAVEKMVLGKTELDVVPSDLYINRHFHVYSDKMHHAIQFAVTKRTENIVEVGMLTEIEANTVSKLIIVTEDGTSYNSLDAGFAWDNVVAVGFDITNAGIFGFILPVDDVAGKIKVELKEGVYVIEQTRTPTANGEIGVIIPSIDTEGRDENGNYKLAGGISNNGNDFYLGQRVYTDESHDFTGFIQETYFERNPLDSRRVSVSESDSNGGEFLGYDAIRGIYTFAIDAPTGGFTPSYNNPNRNYKVNFTIRSDINRGIYVMTSTAGSTLECATLMDSNMMLLPVPIEVIKNFSEPGGERNLFNITDPTFSEAIFYLPLEENKKQEYTIINLYQNWGKYPLKQLSQIPFHCPYYHLSTGVTETNCILPWFNMAGVSKGNMNTLPDFRSMSAPFWVAQPQHNSSGSHTWLAYTDTNGGTYYTESVTNYITSYGPTYAELVWENISDDGKIKVTYTHMEMPQVDENRSYYTMEYEFLEDLTIDSFKDNFKFYEVTDNDRKGSYKKLGYLNENNECVIVDANHDSNSAPEYILGDECPYFSFFMMPDWDRESDFAEGYANLAFLIHSSELVIGGEKKDYNFLIRNSLDHVTLTLNESGTVAFKSGDKITINAIVMPWGSHQYEDGIIDLEASPVNYEYDMLLPDGTLYMDKNVRDVRANTCLDPLKVTSETDEIIYSTFLPKVRSKDGRSAEFTLSGGENNVAVRVYGFDKLTAPKVEEYVDGAWVEYVLSSSENPDKSGIYHYYDGYQVYYDEDGTYSYSFVTTMYDGAQRRFRITAADDFTAWPDEPAAPDREDHLSVYFDAEELRDIISNTPHMYGETSVNESAEDGTYASVYVKLENTVNESYSTLLSTDENAVTGKYLIIKYRVPTTNKESVGNFQIWASTTVTRAEDANSFVHNPVEDGKWHVDVIDLTKTSLKTFLSNDEGLYCAKLLRFDVFNKAFENGDTHIDIAYIGFDTDIMNVCNLEKDSFESISLYEAGKAIEIDTATGEASSNDLFVKDSVYTEFNTLFGGQTDNVNGSANVKSPSNLSGFATFYSITAKEDNTLSISGWNVMEGGAAKYVWTADKGATWHDCGGGFKDAHDEMLNVGQQKTGSVFTDGELAKKNGDFQAQGLIVDLTEYKDSAEPLTVYVCAVSYSNEGKIIVLYCFSGVTFAK